MVRQRSAGGFREFPPTRGRILVPLGSRAAALAGMEMYAACRPRALQFQRAASVAVRLLGPRAVPGRRAAWEPSMSADDWRLVEAQLSDLVGPFDSFAVFRPNQEERAGFGLLLLNGNRRLGYVKFRSGISARLQAEAEAQELAAASPGPVFRVARPLSFGCVAGWSYLLMEALPAGRHRPALATPMEEVIDRVQHLLVGLPRPTGTPHHWVPMHGDLTPWNVRRLADGNLGLLDWENAGWAPPGADHVLWEATRAMLLGCSPAFDPDAEEAREYWMRYLEQGEPDTTKPDERLRHALEETLRLQ